MYERDKKARERSGCMRKKQKEREGCVDEREQKKRERKLSE